MDRLANYICCLVTILLISACGQSTDELAKAKYRELDWSELKPEQEEPLRQGSLEIVEDWYSQDYAQATGITGLYPGAPAQAYSVGVVPELNGESVRLPGFLVPIEFSEGNLVSEFFLVPYFGACFHKPPPPPNQTIYVTSKEPVEYASIYDPVWIMGTLKTEQTGNDIATSAYTVDLHLIEPYLE